MIPQAAPLQQIKHEADWQSALKQAFKSTPDLLDYLCLTPGDFRDQPIDFDSPFPLRVPINFAARIEKKNPLDPLLLQILPFKQEKKEAEENSGFSKDPLQEQSSGYRPLPGLLHKFTSRVLLTLTGACSVHCRYCFRRHFPYEANTPGLSGIKDALDYIQQDSRINEVILSGGDPLSAPDVYLEKVISLIETLPQIKTLRLHTRFPVMIPSRITPHLSQILTHTRLRVVIVLHINHPHEINKQLKEKTTALTLSGITVFNQTVLLKNINDNPTTLIQLSEALFDAHIIPYYLHQLDKVSGTAHFEVPLDTAKNLMKSLYSALPGYLVPRLVQEIPGMPSKYPIPCF